MKRRNHKDLEHYKELDRIIRRTRGQRRVREIKRKFITAAKFFGGALLVYGIILGLWCVFCAMFPTLQ